MGFVWIRCFPKSDLSHPSFPFFLSNVSPLQTCYYHAHPHGYQSRRASKIQSTLTSLTRYLERRDVERKESAASRAGACVLVLFEGEESSKGIGVIFVLLGWSIGWSGRGGLGSKVVDGRRGDGDGDGMGWAKVRWSEGRVEG